MVVESESAVYSDQFSQEETGWFCVRADVAFHLVDHARLSARGMIECRRGTIRIPAKEARSHP